MSAKPFVPSDSPAVPTNTVAADSTSPARKKNESIACLALYFYSGVQGRKSMFRTVLFNE